MIILQLTSEELFGIMKKAAYVGATKALVEEKQIIHQPSQNTEPMTEPQTVNNTLLWQMLHLLNEICYDDTFTREERDEMRAKVKTIIARYPASTAKKLDWFSK